MGKLQKSHSQNGRKQALFFTNSLYTGNNDVLRILKKANKRYIKK